jgi:hypothetical protein
MPILPAKINQNMSQKSTTDHRINHKDSKPFSILHFRSEATENGDHAKLLPDPQFTLNGEAGLDAGSLSPLQTGAVLRNRNTDLSEQQSAGHAGEENFGKGPT